MSYPQPDGSQRRPQSLVIPSRSYATPSAGSLPSTSSPSAAATPSPRPYPDAVDSPYSTALSNGILDWTELELLSHYLTHTSCTIPFDEDDLYALRVGIPNLAFRSKPLMSSILALAAICKSHDLIEGPQSDREKILNLLILAERHYSASLVQVQLDLPSASQYDYVLANATLMVLYASASHCLRIRLAETQRKDEPLPREFIPAQSQWISLIRAAHLAFVGLLHDRSEPANIREDDPEIHPITTPLLGQSLVPSTGKICPQNGPTQRTKDFLFPILAASVGHALKALRAKARVIWKAQGSAATRPDDHITEDAGLRACFTALDIVGGIMTEVFLAKDTRSPNTSCNNQVCSELDSPSLGRLSTVSSWLRSYVARVTSSTSGPRPLRRVIMAFLNRVPAEYLNLVQTTLDSIGMPAGHGHQESLDNSDFELQNPSIAHKFAMDIFAHWLVLVMLLDGVWWIGNIGTWELGRVVSFMRAQSWLDPPLYTSERWWPEGMYNVGVELRSLPTTK